MQKKKGKIQNKVKNLGGRPSDYTVAKGDLICERIATHDCGLPRLCKMYDDMPDEKTVQRWRYKYEEFRVKYAQAKMTQGDLLAEQCLEISDNATYENVAVARLRIDSRKWLASKLLPKLYGERVLLEQKSEDNEREEELKVLRTKLDASNKKDY
jgi:hypothetical protein